MNTSGTLALAPPIFFGLALHSWRKSSGSLAMLTAIRHASSCTIPELQAHHHGEHEPGDQESERNITEDCHGIRPINKPLSVTDLV